MNDRGLTLDSELPDLGTHGYIRINGSYETNMTMDTAEFKSIKASAPASNQIKVLDNAEYTLGVLTKNEQGIVTVNYLNVNVRDRVVFDYWSSRDELEQPPNLTSMKYDTRNLSQDQIEALVDENKRAMDEWTHVYLAPTSTPFELKPTGSVFRGMSNLDQAQDYADTVKAYLESQSIDRNVYVVAGPTSTTKKPYEVVTATAGYTVLYKAVSADAEAQTSERPRG